jgi:hypothetical protein
MIAQAEVEVWRVRSTMKAVLDQTCAADCGGSRLERQGLAGLPLSAGERAEVSGIAELKKLDRYLRRAVSRRDTAIRLCFELTGSG